MSQVLTRDDVFVSKPSTLRIPFILRLTVTQVTIAGHRYEVGTVKSWLVKTHTAVRPDQQPLVEQDSTDTEQAIAALLDVLNAQAREDN